MENRGKSAVKAYGLAMLAVLAGAGAAIAQETSGQGGAAGAQPGAALAEAEAPASQDHEKAERRAARPLGERALFATAGNRVNGSVGPDEAGEPVVAARAQTGAGGDDDEAPATLDRGPAAAMPAPAATPDAGDEAAAADAGAPGANAPAGAAAFAEEAATAAPDAPAAAETAAGDDATAAAPQAPIAVETDVVATEGPVAPTPAPDADAAETETETDGPDAAAEIEIAAAEPPVTSQAAPAPAPDAEAADDPAEAAAPAPDPTMAATPALDPQAQRCLDTAGPPDAGVPASAAQAADKRARLAAAMTDCTAAARAEDAPAEVLFLAAEVAQARRDVRTAFALLERAVAAGLPAAETRIGDYYLFGIAPGGENAAEAIAHYERAAELGDPAGMTTLALMHRVGKGVPRDPAIMVELLGKAADAGYHFAQYRLGQTYLTGDGIPGRADAALGIPDPIRAAALYARAADGGNITAALELARLYDDRTSGLPDDPAEQARLTRIASSTGLPEGIAAMAVLYETGRGVDYNPQIAAGLYVKALETGEVSFDALRRGAPGGWDFDTAIAFQKILQDARALQRRARRRGRAGHRGRGTRPWRRIERRRRARPDCRITAPRRRAR